MKAKSLRTDVDFYGDFESKTEHSLMVNYLTSEKHF